MTKKLKEMTHRVSWLTRPLTMKLIPIDKHGWPVERYHKRPLTNAIRLLLHTRWIITDAEWKRREAEQHRAYAAFGSPTTGT